MSPEARERFEQWEREIDARQARHHARIAELSADERPRAFGDRSSAGWTYLVHRDTYPNRIGAWRVTRLDREMMPAGHSNGKDYRDAIREAHEVGADIFQEKAIA